jgi:hypothetical protein
LPEASRKALGDHSIAGRSNRRFLSPSRRLLLGAGAENCRRRNNSEHGNQKQRRDRASHGPPTLRPLAREACYGAGMGLPVDQRDALRLLAGSPAGCTVTTLMASVYVIVTLHDLVRRGLATAHRENMGAGQRVVGVTRLRITDTGRRALGE